MYYLKLTNQEIGLSIDCVMFNKNTLDFIIFHITITESLMDRSCSKNKSKTKTKF